MEAVKSALIVHNKNNNSQTIYDVTFPNGNYDACRKIFGWILVCIVEGAIVPSE